MKIRFGNNNNNDAFRRAQLQHQVGHHLALARKALYGPEFEYPGNRVSTGLQDSFFSSVQALNQLHQKGGLSRMIDGATRDGKGDGDVATLFARHLIDTLGYLRETIVNQQGALERLAELSEINLKPHFTALIPRMTRIDPYSER